MPIPRGLDDLVEVRVTWFPSEFAGRFLGGGDETGRISRATVFFHHRDWPTGNPPAGFDDFAHRKTGAVAQVEEAVFAGGQGLMWAWARSAMWM